ncbi:MAG: Preprotein translocase subunit SecD [Candidatus Amesbacteria bacterium GW2011_GWB1_47_19]|nr:MAG: Preprotein translocase subunit SecD [Candidatus Amesbacteria bacterium GW2011_GWA1_44_24]KKU31004.1 MAG: Preprotein translocase subunit SecD [Candidatus Amesbacteria bacterium GW2011_GWC1_46_24]KKU67162.1 MAG: Preprotein translocase subunit SecD [Candidatus Amesbacteria bacterium GW2011_GWB1_47_19]OGD05517.1 MAG: protein-export membrane protein SecD [Candidatus Amesbacteria bacterium RIFOXYB1_FULL_47_13]HBC73034.1 protein translocase subunit SecD [Candidatus Amesbacteria bacterium]
MRTSLILSLVLLVAVLINMPADISFRGQKFYRPVINLSLFGKKIYRDLSFKLGLDLQGGSHLVYQADISKIGDTDKQAAIDATRDNIERRVNLLGVAESLVQTSKVGNDYRLIVELPGVKDVKEAIDTIGATAQLEFRELRSDASASAQITDFISTSLTGQDLKLAQVQFGGGSQVGSQPSVGIEFNSDGTKKFAELTKKNLSKPLAIFLDNQLVTAPVVQTEITDGKAVISGQFTLEAAKKLSVQLNAGALPVPIKIVEQRNVGATLGSESVAKSLFAGGVGLAIIWLFMLANYGLKGLLADFALTVYVLLSLAVFKLIPVTLTLSGIAGFILSMGMAVDANILIFERIKEELRWGRPKKAALELGFHRAWTSVRDSNASSLITAGILFWLGTGPVRGFALTLIVGILVSLFTSITITRTLLRAIYSRK